MSKPKILSIFDETTQGTVYSKLNNLVEVTKSGNTILVTSPITIDCDTTLIFESPCSCDSITGISVGGKEFSFRDANCQDLSNLSNLFSEGALVVVLLDVENSYAYVQNANTNSYLESRLSTVQIINWEEDD